MNTPQFFISYRNVELDANWAYWVAWQIELKYGERSCLLQGWDFSPNGNFIKNMHKGALCDFTIVVGSPNYFTSEYTTDEWTAAFHERKLILLEISPCQALGLLAPIFSLRLYDFSEDKASEALYQHLERVFEFKKQGRVKPTTPPNFPNSHFGNSPLSQSPCNLPYPLSPHFVYPEQIWNRLVETVVAKASNITERSVFVLHGLHGIGKTSIACAFGWKHRSNFSAVLWIRGSSKEVFHASLGALCEFEALDLPEQKEPDNIKRVEAVRRWLKGNTGWLLIIDNVDSEEARDFLFECVPATFVGTILITSCLSDWASTCSTIEMLSWTHALGAEFLLKRLNLNKEDWPIVARLSDVLGGLPLALEQAAVYMLQTGMAPGSYLDKVVTDIKQAVNGQVLGATDYAASFSSVIRRSMSQLCPEARFVLELASFMAPSQQMLRIYEVMATHPLRSKMKQQGIPCLIKDTEEHVSELNRWSLINRREDDFYIHPLVQAAVRETLSAAARKKRITLLLHLFFIPIAGAASPSSSGTWQFWRFVFPHMEAFLQYLREIENHRALGLLLNSMGMFLSCQGLHEDACSVLLESLEHADKSQGEDHPDTAGVLCNLADALRSLGRSAEAKPLLLRAIKIIDQHEPLVSHAKSSCWNNLGSCFVALGELDEAEAAYKKAMEYDAVRGGENDVFGLTVKNNMANLLESTGKFKEAEKFYLDVIRHMNDEAGLACAMTNYGTLLYMTGRPSLSVSFLTRALELNARFFPSNHPENQVIINLLKIAQNSLAKNHTEKDDQT